jgi:hypothetical protein
MKPKIQSLKKTLSTIVAVLLFSNTTATANAETISDCSFFENTAAKAPDWIFKEESGKFVGFGPSKAEAVTNSLFNLLSDDTDFMNMSSSQNNDIHNMHSLTGPLNIGAITVTDVSTVMSSQKGGNEYEQFIGKTDLSFIGPICTFFHESTLRRDSDNNETYSESNWQKGTCSINDVIQELERHNIIISRQAVSQDGHFYIQLTKEK